MLQVRDNAILLYNHPLPRQHSTSYQWKANNMAIQRTKRYSGKLSPSAKKRLAKATTLLCQSAKKKWIYNEVTKRYFFHQLSFITLTVSDHEQKLSGKEAYQKLLSHFLQWLRRTKEVTTYIWKAELQKNGQIHYHITTPSFINYQDIRDKWNNLQKRNGLLAKYFSDKGHYNPNSTDIHEVRNIDNIAAYLVKYITKESQNETTLGGKIWDCSLNLKQNNYFTTESCTDYESFMNYCVDQEAASVYHGERFSLYKFKEPPQKHVLTEKEYKRYKEFIHCIRQGKKYIVTTFDKSDPLGIISKAQRQPPPVITSPSRTTLHLAFG